MTAPQSKQVAIPAELEEALSRGWSVIPCHEDKRPALPTWKQYQETRASRDQVQEWAASSPALWAVIGGMISGLVILDFDGTEGLRTMKRLGLAPHVSTPSGGAHVYIQHPGGGRIKTSNGMSDSGLGRTFPGSDQLFQVSRRNC